MGDRALVSEMGGSVRERTGGTGLTLSHRVGRCWTTGWTQRRSGGGAGPSSPRHPPVPVPVHSGHPQSHWSDLQHSTRALSWRVLLAEHRGEGHADQTPRGLLGS